MERMRCFFSFFGLTADCTTTRCSEWVDFGTFGSCKSYAHLGKSSIRGPFSNKRFSTSTIGYVQKWARVSLFKMDRSVSLLEIHRDCRPRPPQTGYLDHPILSQIQFAQKRFHLGLRIGFPNKPTGVRVRVGVGLI